MLRRILGFVLLLIALLGIGLSMWGIRIGHQAVDAFDAEVTNALTLTSQTLDTVQDTLVLTKDTVQTISTGVEAVETTADDLALTINQTRPLMDQIATISSTDLPQTVVAIQETIPSVAQAAGAIDNTLVTLNKFRIDETIPIINYKIDWSLGIDYSPTVPLDQSINQIGDSMQELPDKLRSLEVYVNVTSDNLQTISDDVRTIADDLADVNTQIADLDPLLDTYMGTVTTLNDTSRQTRASISEQLKSIKFGITVVMIWVALTQLVPLYLGVELLLGKRRVS